MKPIIGILAEVDRERVTRVWNTYIRAIENSGGIPIMLPYVEGDDAIRRFADMCDGFCFTGGVDVNPERYGESVKPECGEIQYERDELEFRVLDKIVGTSKPILAVCRGAQLINVYFGGSLYQDIPSEIETEILHNQAEPRFSPSHSVELIPGTPLAALIGKRRMIANSFHHQAIRELGRGLRVMATASDGIIEGVYSDNPQYVRAYQWHPERLHGQDGDNTLIFDDFIKACLFKK